MKQHEAVAADAEKPRAAEKAAGDKDQARVVDVEEILKGMFEARENLQVKGRRTKEELEMLHLALADPKTAARKDRKVLSQLEQITSVKAQLLPG